MPAAAMLRHHLESARRAAEGVPYWVWPLPILLGGAIVFLLETPVGWMTDKPVQEVAAPVILALAAGAAVMVHRWAGESFTLLLACFVAALFVRELHVPGAGNGFYAALLLLAWWASTKRDAMAPFLRHPSIAALLAAAVWTYAVTKLLDRHYLSFLPDYARWHDHVEETLETFAHLMVFALVIVTLRVASLAARPAGTIEAPTRAAIDSPPRARLN